MDLNSLKGVSNDVIRGYFIPLIKFSLKIETFSAPPFLSLLVVNCHHLSSAANTCECERYSDHAERKLKGAKLTRKVETVKQKFCTKRPTRLQKLLREHLKNHNASSGGKKDNAELKFFEM